MPNFMGAGEPLSCPIEFLRNHNTTRLSIEHSCYLKSEVAVAETTKINMTFITYAEGKRRDFSREHSAERRNVGMLPNCIARFVNLNLKLSS